jgi:hypothetical protein
MKPYREQRKHDMIASFRLLIDQYTIPIYREAIQVQGERSCSHQRLFDTGLAPGM